MPRARALLLFLLAAATSPAQIELAYDQGTVGLIGALRRLETTARVLHVAAHPDDEDSALLAYLARGLGARTVYLSLNRGEGGQNSIGGELFEPLGIVRTGELLAARRLDGAEQIFGTVFDFGFSKSADETLRFWGRDAALADIVRAIRVVRPQVIITRFLGDPGDGHGHHQAAGLLCREAFRAAGDPAVCPEQLAAGLHPWQATRLYADRWNLPDPPQTVEVGEFSPLYGRSYQSIAFEGRSRHRSQDMGRTYARGPARVPLVLLDSVDGVDPAAPFLGGLELTVPGIVPRQDGEQPAWRRTAAEALAEAAAARDRAEGYLQPGLYPRRVVDELAQAVREFRRAHEALLAPGVPDDATVAAQRAAVRQKLSEAQRALVLAAGIELDGLADAAAVAPGGTVTVTVQAFWPSVARIAMPRLRVEAPAGWEVTALDTPPAQGDGVPAAAAGFRVTVPASAPPTQPYWLRRDRDGYRFQVDGDDPVGEPFDPPLMLANLRCVVADEPVSIAVGVVRRTGDPRRGERRAPVAVLPAVSAELTERQVLISPGQPARVLVPMRLTAHGAAVEGDLCWLADGQAPIASAPIKLAAGETAALQAPLDLPALTGRRTLRLALGETPLWLVRAIDYDHLEPRQYLLPATVIAVPVAAELAVAPRIGYIPGPGDRLPEALARLGLATTTLDAAALRAETLPELDVILVGLRAYETNAALRAAQPRLRAWMEAGGVMIVQYQQYELAEGGLAPYPLTYHQPHDRVTDETAPVTMLHPDHPLLSRPNRLTEADFGGWVQERGLYFPRSWDAAYTPLLACADPGDEPRAGGLLAAEVGRGAYVYCAYALFRQLPEGVPGAYRLLANLVSYPRTR